MCDRCSCVIDDRVVVLDTMNGVVPKLRERVDLCSRCADLFADWLAEGKGTARQSEARTA
jgi:hypothetical protein